MFERQKRQVFETMAGCRWRDVVQNVPSRLSRGLPSVILAVLLNALDAASTGLLVFPSAQQSPAFANLQVQAMSIYIMSTIMSQLVMTLGGSLFPGALGSMLIEVLPFVRGIATDIQGRLGADSPKLLPTVLAAYAITSFLIGFCFLALGLLRMGWMVEYIPSTVLNGTIGAIGLSLFMLGLELTLPPVSSEITLPSTKNVLFTAQHAPLLVASVVPTVLLCVSMRSEKFSKLTRGLTDHAMYVPTYVISIAAVFWITVAAKGYANGPGMETLAATGWLFTVQASPGDSDGQSALWNYWKLFDLNLIEWGAMVAATQNILLLLIIGVLNLPIFIPAMGVMLNEPAYNMDWELVGHGLSNIFSGAVGSLPNLVVLANSRLFTFANGGRPEALVATGFTVVLFFYSTHLLTYVPTIVASTLVLFLGLDLLIEALWTSALELLWSEWTVVLGTVLACTVIGFLPGFLIGLGLAILQHLGWELYDSRALSVTIYQHASRKNKSLFALVIAMAKENQVIHTDRDVNSPPRASGRKASSVTSLSLHDGCWADSSPTDVISVSGNLFFATIPSLEHQLEVALKKATNQVVLDFSNAHRCETCVGQLIKRKVQQYSSEVRPQPLSFAGFQPDSGLVLDLSRGGISCFWPQFSEAERGEDEISCYPELSHALSAWSNLPQSSPSRTSDDDVLRAADALLGGVNTGHSIRTAFPEESISIHRLGAGQWIEIHAPSCVFIVQGAFKVREAIKPLDDFPKTRWAYQSRRDFATMIAAALRVALNKGRRVIYGTKPTLDDESYPERAPLLGSIDGNVVLRTGDCYCVQDQSDLERSGEAQSIIAMCENCWAISLPGGEDVEAVRQFLARLEMNRAESNGRIWRL
ncbi:hypothetical protein QQS21_001257 [Conoideocrella luteorostrata]|uniref:STAS domain-containing protein n=1 Tax=Conoideocrella luteorostrata TaxID=1105319 RepID=A0AAJ0CXM0_9HYPO|nr:hypothetical protein QQS21_001257 [Conoideocrella luteorostrata]